METIDLIIGAGEVGRSIYNVISQTYPNTFIRDTEPLEIDGQIRYLHIAIPYTGNRFIEIVNNYIAEYSPRVTIVHSTVAPGTTAQLTVSAVHSPVIGKHPNLEGGITTFEKWVCGKGSEEVAEYLKAAGINAIPFSDPLITEVGKLLDTTRYGLNIGFAQEQARICRKYGIPYETVVSAYQKNYNRGYQELGMGYVTQPVLTPGVIGGHCVMPNIEILKKHFHSEFFDSIVHSNQLQKKNADLISKYDPIKNKERKLKNNFKR